MTTYELLKTHFEQYPEMKPQDAVKLLYQGEFGGGHMIDDEVSSLERIRKEWKGRLKSPLPGSGGFEEEGGKADCRDELLSWCEPVGNGLFRLSLCSLDHGLLPETLNRMFVITASEKRGSREGFQNKLAVLSDCAANGIAPFTRGELDCYLSAYEKEGCPAVSHSPEYRSKYHPSYRIVSEPFIKFLQIFYDIDRCMEKITDRPVLVSLDGKSGSGKSTLGGLLKQVYGCGLFHMDDFFLRPSQRTGARLMEPGGNVDYERFHEEVLDHVIRGEDFSYRRYDCCSQTLTDPIEVKAARLNIVEGVYSRHPYFGECYDLNYFLTISEEEQKRRILERNGPVMLERFLNEWIPMENRYFEEFGIDGTVINV